MHIGVACNVKSPYVTRCITLVQCLRVRPHSSIFGADASTPKKSTKEKQMTRAGDTSASKTSTSTTAKCIHVVLLDLQHNFLGNEKC
ncbi:unnamed protein product [Cylicocyclus nassatus]|uniref:Uncharacterized protein n=1 Tax=Cylicocyclus nassatus TaxID=53992 RepID=A0AA36H8J1_CYLNA|nr:unnamed protein product [Cylicocyclus nassatus]